MSDDAYQENLKVATFAGSGIGKTVGIGSLIAAYGAENVGIISCEHGLNTIASQLRADMVNVCDTLGDFQAAITWAEERFPKADQWVCIDGGSRLLQWLEQDTFGRAEAELTLKMQGRPPSDTEYAVYLTKEGVLDTRRLWSKLGARAERMFNRFVRMKSSHYWSFWSQQPFIDAYTKGPTWTIDSPGDGTRKAVVASMDYIYMLTRDRDGRLVSKHKSDAQSFAKNRDERNAGVRVPDTIVDFDLADFCERVKGKGWN